ncbi:MAG TPA: hypothetical protein VGK50_01585 [Coriobacteriia bacterium]|jgi:hypothetical protein
MSAKDRWSLRNIYLYLVCLITLIMVIFAIVNGVRGVVQLVYPNPGYFAGAPVPEKGVPATGPSKAEVALQQAQDRRNSILDLVGSVAMLAVAGPVYLYHWRRIERDIAEETPPATTA